MSISPDRLIALKPGDHLFVRAIVADNIGARMPTNWPIRVVLDDGASETIDRGGMVHFSALYPTSEAPEHHRQIADDLRAADAAEDDAVFLEVVARSIDELVDSDGSVAVNREALHRLVDLARKGAGLNSQARNQAEAAVPNDLTPERRAHVQAGIDAARAAFEGGDGWRPIETAPKDESTILVYEPPPEGSDIHWFDVVEYRHPDRGPAGWHSVGNGRYSALSCYPTHWRPLPAPPAAPAEGGA